ncbi:hypothetical protein N0V82_006641 [Gnomoniopsis sp. IMI 355080]|nr:hypothetical protein N0V82_006641 [Gnomoniopsis sp. IMI 355080]
MASTNQSVIAATLDWKRPGPAEKAVTAEFIQSHEAKEIRQIVPDPPPYNSEQGRFVSAKPATQRQLKSLLSALEAALPDVLGLYTPIATTCEGWDELTDKVLTAEKDYDKQGKEIWHRIWHGIGNASEVVDAWSEVIPNEYGLAVVKTAVAVIFKLAARSVDKRKKIAQAFEDIHTAMTSASPLKGSFRSHTGVAIALDELQQAIVDSVNDMIILTAREEHFWRGLRKKLTQRTKRPDVSSVLQLLAEKTQRLKAAMDIARDQSIETIDKTTKYTAIYVSQGLSHLDSQMDVQRGELHNVSSVVKEQGEKMDRFSAMLESMQAWTEKQSCLDAAPDGPAAEWLNTLMDALISQKKDISIQDLTDLGPRCPPRRRRAVINERHFCEAIADPVPNEDGIPDVEGLIAQPISDWKEISMYRGDFDSKTQSRVQSLLQQGRFLAWMKGSYPDLLLVLADLPTSGMEKITAVSLFCATLVTSLMNLRREDVVVHFFCGLHVHPQDPNPGPTGLVRSLIMQVFMHLRRDGHLSLDFLDDRAIVQAIEDQDLEILCQTLQSLLDQFQAGTQVFCIIDSITLFDSEEWSLDLMTVLEYLHETVQDGKLPAIFKVMLTSSALCAPEVTDLLTMEDKHPDRVLSLSADNISVEDDMGNYEMERHLSQVSVSPRSGSYRLTSEVKRRRHYGDDYD